MTAYCDCCQEKRPCVKLVTSPVMGDTYACHACRGKDDTDCDECQEAAEQEATHA